MNITEIRVKMVGDNAERLRAFCSVTLDGDFVVRDLKVIEGTNGPFVAMPSRKLSDRCPRCGSKNHLRARYCNDCGAHLKENRAPRDSEGHVKLHADVAHPINSACRAQVQEAVIEAYERELEHAGQPGYQPKSLDDVEVVEDVEDASTSDYDELVAELKEQAASRSAERAEARPSRQVDSETSEPDERTRNDADAGAEPEPGPAASPPPAPSPPPLPSPPPAPSPPPSRSAPAEEPGRPPDDDGFGAGIV